MGGLDPAKILVILALALVLLGPERLPKAARQVGAFWRDVQDFRARVEEEVRGALPDIDIPKIPSIPRGGVTGYLTGMMADADRATRSPGRAGVAEEDGDTGDTGPPDGAGSRGGRSRRIEDASPAQWQSAPRRGSTRFTSDGGNPSPVTAPAGMPAGWGSRGAEAPGYASGSLLSSVPGGAPEGLLGAEARLDLDDPSWN